MFILSLTYVKPQEDADRLMEPHMTWVKQGYDSGMFLASGRKVPRTGGVILAKGERTDIESFVAGDPFAVHGVADYEITEVAITTALPQLELLKG